MKNLEKVATRLKEAAQKKEQLIIFTDSDLDGVTSAIILEDAFSLIGGESVVYVSNRDKWGHGLTAEAVADITEISGNKRTSRLLVTLDCGISNFEGITAAQEKGCEVIIIDHHRVVERVPEADFILDPHQPGDNSYFKKLANAGIVYKLVEVLLGDSFKNHRRLFLELLVVAIVADMMPREEDNALYMEEGLPLLERPQSTGLSVIKRRSEQGFLEKTVSLLNISSMVGKQNETYIFLKTNDINFAEEMLDVFEKRQEIRKAALDEATKDIIAKAQEDEHFVLYGGEFEETLGGKIAARVMQYFKKTSFIYRVEGDRGKGSVRTIKGEDAVAIMSYCKDFLESYGGHPEAAGFVVFSKKVDGFREALRIYYSTKK